MPWRIAKRGNQYCVVKETTNETLKCYSDRSQARAYLRALYANEPAMRPSARRAQVSPPAGSDNTPAGPHD